MALIAIIIFAIMATVSKLRGKKQVKRNVVLLICAAVIFFGLVSLDLYFVFSGIEKNKEQIKNSAEEKAMQAAEIAGKGFVKTFDSILKSWDERSVKRMDNIDVSIINSSQKVESDKKTYRVEVLFNNKNSSNSESITIGVMIGGNYLMFCDKDDIVYAVDDVKNESLIIPLGKSKETFTIEVEKNVELKYLRFVNKKVSLK